MNEALVDISDSIQKRLPTKIWQKQQKDHQRAITEIVDPYLEKRNRHLKDPVLDFLFEYYAFRPSYLQRWSPGIGVVLEQADNQSAPAISEFTIDGNGAYLNPKHFPEKRRRAARWIAKLLENSLEKTPSFGCFGMHEWAMVYKNQAIRHEYLALRMSPEKLAGFVESRPLVCTHFDAFRFFTKPAKPLNKFALSSDTIADNEQAGCLHTNMDLYKWAFKFFPWISSDRIREAFLLAVDTRIMDMQASPYDLQEYGLEPIKIENEEGRLEYMKRQKKIYQRSVPVREKLIKEYKNLMAHF